MTVDHPLVVAVVGPTASGKSELALRIAETIGGEIVSADAMQLYRGMDIGTAKLSPVQRRGIPHHQLDVLEVTDEANIAAYQTASRADIAAISSRGLHPIVVGGSGLYVRAALDRLEIPPTEPKVRARLEAQAERDGHAAMHAALAAADPVAAQRILPANARRVIRALEVMELTGRKFSATMPARTFLVPTVMVGLQPPRATLDSAIEARVHQMWAGGMIQEVRHLVELGLRTGRTSSRALGYSQALQQLDGTMTQDDAIESTAQDTRRLARRQQSWFGPDDRISWFDPVDERGLDAAVQWVRDAVAEKA